MAKKPTITTVSSGYLSTTTLNNNFEALRDAFDNTLSRDGSTPNTMLADLDMNSNDILNVNEIDAQAFLLDGSDLSTALTDAVDDAEAAQAAAEVAQAAAAVSAAEAAEASEVNKLSREDLVTLIAGGYTLSDGATIFADGIAYIFEDGATDISDLPGLIPAEPVYPDHFATNTTPGTTDMTAAIQAAIDFSVAHAVSGRFKGGYYGIATGIQWKQGARFQGAGNWSGVSSLYKNIGTTVLLYTGGSVANSCVVRVSSVAVGTEGSASDQIQNMGLTHVTIDGRDTAEYGIYFNRSWSHTQFDFITVTGTTKHGFWAGNCWNATHRNWMAFKNIGAGITLGINTFGWSQCTVDQSVLSGFMGYYSGHNASTTTQNAFNESGGEDLEYGIGVANGRDLVLLNPQGQECSGAGIYHGPGSLNPITIEGMYVENNGKSSSATRRWDLWYEPSTSTLGTTIRKPHFGVAATGAIKIAGSGNTTRLEGALIIEGATILPTIDADHKYYRLVNCDRDPTAYVGTKPTYFGGRLNESQNLQPIGLAVFYVDTGAIVELRKEGAVGGIAYNGVGDYTITLTETMPNGTWIAQAQATADNRYARAHTYTATNCGISHKSLTNVAADPTADNIAIRVVIYPSYT